MSASVSACLSFLKYLHDIGPYGKSQSHQGPPQFLTGFDRP